MLTGVYQRPCALCTWMSNCVHIKDQLYALQWLTVCTAVTDCMHCSDQLYALQWLTVCTAVTNCMHCTRDCGIECLGLWGVQETVTNRVTCRACDQGCSWRLRGWCSGGDDGGRVLVWMEARVVEQIEVAQGMMTISVVTLGAYSKRVYCKSLWCVD